MDNDCKDLESAENWSKKIFMASRLHFADVITALQQVGKELALSVLLSLKFHAKLAGKAMKHSRGVLICVHIQFSRAWQGIFKASISTRMHI